MQTAVLNYGVALNPFTQKETKNKQTHNLLSLFLSLAFPLFNYLYLYDCLYFYIRCRVTLCYLFLHPTSPPSQAHTHTQTPTHTLSLTISPQYSLCFILSIYDSLYPSLPSVFSVITEPVQTHCSPGCHLSSPSVVMKTEQTANWNTQSVSAILSNFLCYNALVDYSMAGSFYC